MSTILAALICVAAGAGLAAQSYAVRIPVGLIEPDVPLDDPLTDAKVELGRVLFFEPRLSADGSLSCATCHDPNHAFAEPRSLSRGIGRDSRRRNTQSVLNAGYQEVFDWDGRFSSLEEQITGVFGTYGDMGVDLGEALERIADDSKYRRLFQIAFAAPPSGALLRRALAAYQRSLTSGDSPFDRFLFRGQRNSLTSAQQRGWELFKGKAGCITCHDVFHPEVNALGGGVALFTDHRFHNLGVGYENGRFTDTGRFEVTREAADIGAFRTPSLRNAALTAPYMHDGSLTTLKEVVALYDRGGNANPYLSSGVQRLFLTAQESADLVSFLEGLTDETLED